MSDQTKADITGMRDFGTKTQSALQTAQNGVGSAAGKLGSAMTGMVGTNEAKTFADWYKSVVEATTQGFMKDLPMGLAALGNGAIVEAANYQSGDESQATQMQGVMDMFNPDPKKHTLADDFAANTNKVRDKSEIKPKPLPKAQAEAVPPSEAQAPSPQMQVDEHNRKYQNDEKWRPPAPPAPPEPKTRILAPGPIGEQPQQPTVY